MKISGAVWLVLVFAAGSVAQSSADTSLKHGANELGVWGGASFSPVTAFSGITPAEAKGRKFVIVGLQYARVLSSKKGMSLEYTIDGIPLALATNDMVQVSPATPRKTAYGFGLTPLGLRLNLRNSSRVKPFVTIGAGGMLFNRPVPLPDAGKFAFTLEGGGGVRWFRSSGRAIWLGAKLHHISNGNLSGSNRGINQIVIFTGFSMVK